MNDLDQLSVRLLKHQKFSTQLREVFEQLYEQKSRAKKQDDFIRPLPQSDGFNLKQKNLEEEGANDMEVRCSMSSSAFHKRQSRDSISSMGSNPIFSQYLHAHSSQTLSQITNQITGLLSEIIKRESQSNHTTVITTPVAVESNSISQLIEKMSELQREQTTKLKQMIESKVVQLKTEIQGQVFSVIEKLKAERKNRKMMERASQIKRQRRKVTQSILDISKNNQEMSTFSNIYDGGDILSDSEDEDKPERRDSPELSQLSSKISEVQKSQSKISKEFEIKFSKEVEQNSKDIQAVTERIIEWKMKSEEKLQNGFSGVWNVVTDIEDKLNKVALKMAELEHMVDESLQ